MTKLIGKFLTPYEDEKFKYKNCFKIFYISIILGAIIFLPFVIYNKGIFVFYGDYNIQQIPFYQIAHDAVRKGEFGINWLTDLGSNFIASYSFYLLGSPFFWLTIPFPNSFVPYLMAPIFVLKFGVASITSYIFIRKFTKTNKAAFFGALLYSFSGFSIYNVFYNHFHEIIAFFPILLIGFENLITNKKKGVFALGVAINLIASYYFFVPEIVFLFIYAIFRCFTKKFKINMKIFLLIILEGIIGVMIGFILFLPSALMVLKNPRVCGTLLGFDIIFYSEVQKYGLLLHSLFFPPDMPSFANFFPDAAADWYSVAAYMPMIGMIGVISFLKGAKNNWLKRILITLFIMTLFPFLNSAFNGFNMSFYTRWFFALTLILAVCSSISIERYLCNFKFATKLTLIVLGAFSLIGIIPKKIDKNIVFFSLPKFPVMFWINIAIAALGVLIIIFLFIKKNKKQETIYLKSIICLIFFIAIYSIAQFTFVKFPNAKEDYKEIVVNGIKANFDLFKNDKDFYRIEIWPEKFPNNLHMFWKIPSVQTFQSTVPASIMSFYKNMGIQRDVQTIIPSGKYNNLRDFLSVKYIFIKSENYKNDKILPANFKFLKEENDFRIYKNEKFIGVGLVMNEYIEKSEFKKISYRYRDSIIKNAVILSKEQIKKYEDILTKYPENKYKKYEKMPAKYYNELENYTPKSCEKFIPNSYGFKASINLPEEKLILFTVPYEKDAFFATINGEKTKIEEVDCGLMAVKGKKGQNEIEFSYKTPGLKEGMIISLAGIFIYFMYILIILKLKNKDYIV